MQTTFQIACEIANKMLEFAAQDKERHGGKVEVSFTLSGSNLESYDKRMVLFQDVYNLITSNKSLLREQAVGSGDFEASANYFKDAWDIHDFCTHVEDGLHWNREKKEKFMGAFFEALEKHKKSTHTFTCTIMIPGKDAVNEAIATKLVESAVQGALDIDAQKPLSIEQEEEFKRAWEALEEHKNRPSILSRLLSGMGSFFAFIFSPFTKLSRFIGRLFSGKLASVYEVATERQGPPEASSKLLQQSSPALSRVNEGTNVSSNGFNDDKSARSSAPQ